MTAMFYCTHQLRQTWFDTCYILLQKNPYVRTCPLKIANDTTGTVGTGENLTRGVAVAQYYDLQTHIYIQPL